MGHYQPRSHQVPIVTTLSPAPSSPTGRHWPTLHAQNYLWSENIIIQQPAQPQRKIFPPGHDLPQYNGVGEGVQISRLTGGCFIQNHFRHKNQTRLDVRHDGLKSRWIKSITSIDVDNLLLYMTTLSVFLMSRLVLIVCKPVDQHREVKRETATPWLSNNQIVRIKGLTTDKPQPSSLCFSTQCSSSVSQIR